MRCFGARGQLRVVGLGYAPQGLAARCRAPARGGNRTVSRVPSGAGGRWAVEARGEAGAAWVAGRSAPMVVSVAAWCLEWVKPEGWEEFGMPVGGDAHCPFAVVDDPVMVPAYEHAVGQVGRSAV
jgi:hypothetical protein